ncbi:MAG: alpha/beta hydrolase [Armatimonadota bacterium]|nr:alpha/beta hydrolase [Armatimonadota bacterium]MDR7427848.1 alpha/beta hydrolase [Armatimonadota bacterium]MDR7471138.1 alpha/beta hydrolase [Armatimonadota bacterium]MDR7475312.1 alpha/beta hydrolase [Armatimonadota bacterium]MDR7539955.1 alpha/beta hydrolase [Armatimonadota bacterium]
MSVNARCGTAAVLLAVLLAAGTADVATGEQAAAAGAGGAGPSGQPVSFTTSDGITLAGTLFGSGPAGVVLAHMFPTDQTSWHPFARQLAAEGFRALAFDFRGYGQSGGPRRIDLIDRDVRAASAYLRGQGVQRVALVGASMGGTAAIKVAAGDGAGALVVISSPQAFRGLVVSSAELARLRMPSLWISSGGDSVTPAMRAMYAAAGGARTLHIYPGSAHGTYLFDSPYGADLAGRILVFIARAVPPR